MTRRVRASAPPHRFERSPPYEDVAVVKPLSLKVREAADRFGLKGPGAPAWLAAQGIAMPPAPNTWLGPGGPEDEGLLVARLGSSEFFLEDGLGGTALRDIEPLPGAHPPGVYPVLREDASFLLEGQGALDVMAQVCNVNFADLDLAAARPSAARPTAARPIVARPSAARPLIMTSMIGVSVLVVPHGGPRDVADSFSFRIWCDPTFGAYLGESLRQVVGDCGGDTPGVSV
jgi:sarcosine oxidase subunit gamma